jgi:hypothetical protein
MCPHLRNDLVRPAFAFCHHGICHNMSSRDMSYSYRQSAADAKQRAAHSKDPSIKIAFEHVAAFWLGLAEQLDWIDRGEVSAPRRKIIAKSAYSQTYVRTPTAVRKVVARQP